MMRSKLLRDGHLSSGLSAVHAEAIGSYSLLAWRSNTSLRAFLIEGKPIRGVGG